ncbi:hypothetical protein L1887_48735 [Cichorium endivia]|nr:hypothetical protein L1887_48735 [Cichorium endivia]
MAVAIISAQIWVKIAARIPIINPEPALIARVAHISSAVPKACHATPAENDGADDQTEQRKTIKGVVLHGLHQVRAFAACGRLRLREGSHGQLWKCNNADQQAARLLMQSHNESPINQLRTKAVRIMQSSRMRTKEVEAIVRSRLPVAHPR